jgi:DNA recombination protein RmuC
MLRGQQKWREQGDALTKMVGEKVEGSIGVFGEVRERLGELTKSTRDIEEVGKSIANLQEALRAPKFRGGFGELGLETLLANILPPNSYSLQKKFRNGEVIVDAVVKIGNTFVPIDSKFPFSLEDFAQMVTAESSEEQGNLRRQFTRTLKKHVDNVAKYILPDENTFDFALMYIPAENIYYETIVRDPHAAEENSLYSYCCERRVFPVSPNTFYAYLQAIVLGLRGLRIESSAREILGRLERLRGDFNAFQRDYETLGGHIHRATAKYDEASTKLTRLGDKLQLADETPVEELPDGNAELPDEVE